jgi:MFS family permease
MQAKRQPGIPFILVTVFLDTLAFGFVIPVLPALVATMTPDKHSQAYWYGLLLGSFGLAQFFSAPLLGAISDRWGRRTVLLISIFGLGLNFLITAVSPWLWLLLVSRLIGGASGAAFRGGSLCCRCNAGGTEEPELWSTGCHVWTGLYLWSDPGRGLAKPSSWPQLPR